MINDLDETLRRLLEWELSRLENVNIYFDTPGGEFQPTKPAVNLFLYDVRENRDQRNVEWQLERREGRAVKTPPPVRVDCSYLITAWVGGDDNTIVKEHELLGQVMKALLRYPVIPADWVYGELAGGEIERQDLPLPTATLQPGRLQSLGEFWQALEGKPKAALHYTVTISVRAGEPAEAPLVTDTTIKLRLEKKTAS